MSISKIASLAGLFLVLSLASCTPLEKAIKEIAPGYTPKSPALDTPDLGHRMIGKKLDINECYKGEIEPRAPVSWDKINLVYEGDIKGDLTADFGNTVKVSGGGENKSNSEVVLEKLSEQRLKKLFMNPKSQCAENPTSRKQYMDSDGSTDRVVVKAVLAEKISITSRDTTSGHLEVNVPVTGGVKVGGSGSASGTDKQTWEGTRLYFAHLVQPFKTKLLSAVFPSIPVPGSTDKVEACAFKITGVGVDEWTGDLNCDGDNGVPAKLRAQHNSSDGLNTAAGVSYGVTVSPLPTAAGFVKIEINKWLVTE